jgi:hypothetical protein
MGRRVRVRWEQIALHSRHERGRSAIDPAHLYHHKRVILVTGLIRSIGLFKFDPAVTDEPATRPVQWERFLPAQRVAAR